MWEKVGQVIIIACPLGVGSGSWLERTHIYCRWSMQAASRLRSSQPSPFRFGIRVEGFLL